MSSVSNLNQRYRSCCCLMYNVYMDARREPVPVVSLPQKFDHEDRPTLSTIILGMLYRPQHVRIQPYDRADDAVTVASERRQ
jgi:hypothetical protein